MAIYRSLFMRMYILKIATSVVAQEVACIYLPIPRKGCNLFQGIGDGLSQAQTHTLKAYCYLLTLSKLEEGGNLD